MRQRKGTAQWKADVGGALHKTLSNAPPVKAALVIVTAILGIQHLRERARKKNAPHRLQRVTNSFKAPDDAGEDVPEVEWVDLSLGALQPMSPPPPSLELEVLKHAFRCDAASLLRFLCHPDSSFLRERSNALRYENVAPGPWLYSTDATGKRVRVRELYYEVPVKSSFGPSHAHVTESQAIETFPWGFVVHVHARNPNVPFGKRFFTQLLYVGWRLDQDSCCLLVTAKVVFTGSAGMLRGIIAASTQAGLLESYAAMLQLMCARFESAPLPPDLDASLLAAAAAAGVGQAAGAPALDLPALAAEGRRSKEVYSLPPSPLAPATLTSPTTAILVALCAAVLVFVVCYALVPALLPDLQRLVGCAQEWLVRAQMPLRGFAGVPPYAAPPRRWW